MDPADLESRFILKSDLKNDEFIFKLNPYWISRPYEYAWVSKFIDARDISLDAACGISHPLKFYLAEKSKEVHAVDIDKRILSKDAIIKGIIDDFGEDSKKNIKEYWFKKIQFRNSSITALPYENNYFDKIFCISVLEHLPDFLNRYPFFGKHHIPLLKNDIQKAMKEFNRILKPDGLLILTFDYPDINLDYLMTVIRSSNFNYCGKVDYTIPKNSLLLERANVRFFRAALRKMSK